VGQATAQPLNPRFWAVALHWNGRSWRRYRVPAPKAATSSELNFLAAVAGRSCAEICAVGYYSTPSAAQRSLSVRC
jgi:hypothetical protein